MAGASRPPARPASPADTPNAASFHAVTFTPLVAAAISEFRIARSTRPVFDLLRFQTASTARRNTPRVNRQKAYAPASEMPRNLGRPRVHDEMPPDNEAHV